MDTYLQKERESGCVYVCVYFSIYSNIVSLGTKNYGDIKCHGLENHWEE